MIERSKSLTLKEFCGGESEFYRAIYRASQIKGREFFFLGGADSRHTTQTLHATKRRALEIEIEDSSLGARIFLSFRLFLVLNFMNSISILVLFLIMDS